MARLTAKQKAFVAEYLIDLNATQAAIRAKYSEKTAEQAGSRLLSNVKVQEAVQEAMKNREQRTQITQDKVLNEIAKIAFANGTDFASLMTGMKKEKVWNEETQEYEEIEVERQFVQFVDTDTLPPDKKAAIAAIKETRYGIAVESCDKVKALELLGRHLGMFNDKVKIESDVSLVIHDDIQE